MEVEVENYQFCILISLLTIAFGYLIYRMDLMKKRLNIIEMRLTVISVVLEAILEIMKAKSKEKK